MYPQAHAPSATPVLRLLRSRSPRRRSASLQGGSTVHCSRCVSAGANKSAPNRSDPSGTSLSRRALSTARMYPQLCVEPQRESDPQPSGGARMPRSSPTVYPRPCLPSGQARYQQPQPFSPRSAPNEGSQCTGANHVRSQSALSAPPPGLGVVGQCRTDVLAASRDSPRVARWSCASPRSPRCRCHPR